MHVVKYEGVHSNLAMTVYQCNISISVYMIWAFNKCEGDVTIIGMDSLTLILIRSDFFIFMCKEINVCLLSPLNT